MLRHSFLHYYFPTLQWSSFTSAAFQIKTTSFFSTLIILSQSMIQPSQNSLPYKLNNFIHNTTITPHIHRAIWLFAPFGISSLVDMTTHASKPCHDSSYTQLENVSIKITSVLFHIQHSEQSVRGLPTPT